MSNSAEEKEILDDLKGRRWTRLGEAPRELLLVSTIVAWDDSKAIILGGYEIGADRSSVFIYNIETFETEALPSMLQARRGHTAVIVGGNLFVIGGYGPNGYTNSIEVLDLNDPREWKQFPVNWEKHDIDALLLLLTSTRFTLSEALLSMIINI